MSTANDFTTLLQCTPQPAFLVRDGIIQQVNQGAAGYLLQSGECVEDLIAAGLADYRRFTQGCLYLPLLVQGHLWNASVRKLSDGDLFLLEDDGQPAELRALALAAKELRGPLADLMTTADRLLPASSDADPGDAHNAALHKRSLYQILRVIGNMSDASRYYSEKSTPWETHELCGLFREVARKADALLSRKDLHICFHEPAGTIYTVADREKLERALHNMLSNAVQHMPKGGQIDVRLRREGRSAYLTVEDTGTGTLRGDSLFTRYRRAPALESEVAGIGLGMPLILAAARAHDGTVLVLEREGGGLSVTLSMALRQSTETQVRSRIRMVDYAGEMDHLLIELSGVLDADVYAP